MTHLGCSLLACAADEDRSWDLEDYAGAVARWCPGCGDHAVLTVVERVLEAEQLPPERTVFVSGIGCSSRFPHYVRTYGFHGLHGRALPVATGIRHRRPDLHVFVVMGDGDCCSIGAGHWVYTTRYNPKMVALLLDNGVYGLTKNQTSTTPAGAIDRARNLRAAGPDAGRTRRLGDLGRTGGRRPGPPGRRPVRARPAGRPHTGRAVVGCLPACRAAATSH